MTLEKTLYKNHPNVKQMVKKSICPKYDSVNAPKGHVCCSMLYPREGALAGTTGVENVILDPWRVFALVHRPLGSRKTDISWHFPRLYILIWTIPFVKDTLPIQTFFDNGQYLRYRPLPVLSSDLIHSFRMLCHAGKTWTVCEQNTCERLNIIRGHWGRILHN